MDRTKATRVALGLVAAWVLAAGCITTATVPLGQNAPTTLTGNMRLHATDTVPFEYKEVAYHAFHGENDVNVAISRFCREVRDMGGDAVLRFRCRPGDCGNHYVLEGIVVKITRP